MLTRKYKGKTYQVSRRDAWIFEPNNRKELIRRLAIHNPKLKVEDVFYANKNRIQVPDWVWNFRYCTGCKEYKICCGCRAFEDRE